MIIYLQMRAPFLDLPPRADTLFGAICWALRWLYGEDYVVKLLEEFSNLRPPFLLSSVYPFVNCGGEKIVFFPKPYLPPSSIDVRDLKRSAAFSAYKKARFVSPPIFQRMIQDQWSEEQAIETLHIHGRGPLEPLATDTLALVGNILLDYDTHEKMRLHNTDPDLIHTAEVPHASINRLTGSVGEGLFFYSQESRPPAKGGFYFLLKFLESECEERLLAAIRFLGDKGLCGDASVGRGAFEIQVANEEPFAEPENPTHFTILSPFHPSKEDLDFLAPRWSECYYQVFKKKGKVETMYLNLPDERVWKDTVILFEEGSVFPYDPSRIHFGHNPIVKQEPFDVQQYGFPYPVRMVM